MYTLDAWIAAWLVPLAVYVLISGLDDLFLDLAFVYRWLMLHLFGRPWFAWPTLEEVDAAPRRRIAIFVPLWHEHGVIGSMLERNIPATMYYAAEFFVGAYPNDAETVATVRNAARKFPRVHLALCPHDGPTSKADCLNWIYQRMLAHEESHGVRFDMVVTHDAEDVIHPESMRWINYFAGSYDMVQVPVLPLATPVGQWVHGLYGDEFAEFQTKDIPVRQMWGAFLPGNGVGTAFSRAVLEKLAEAHSNRLFDPECLTEDYENGWRIHALGCRQVFIPLRREGHGLLATREYFPHTFHTAVRQRARWVMGIVLQSWERRGWRAPARDIYWLWRDRKGILGNLLTPVLNLLFVYGAVTWGESQLAHHPWIFGMRHRAFQWLFSATFVLSGFQMGVRALCSRRVYGWRFAMGVPVRMLIGNWLNCAATVRALALYGNAKAHGRPLVWVKTEHAYPNPAALDVEIRPLGQILVGSQYVLQADVDAAMTAKAVGERIGEYLVRRGKLSEAELYVALSLQQNLPLAALDASEISASATRALPGEVARRWRVLPFRVVAGQLFVAGPELPSDEMTEDLRRSSEMEIQFHLVTPTDFEELARTYLGEGMEDAVTR
ncbi:MAG TPA: glycosyl transferase family protein [Bryobacteraceae bacterium]|jgi:adsorption protein B|nr:glycosyl transferase family protein [Bryobacteraceae bacterium]